MVELERGLQEAFGLGRNIGRDGRLRTHADLVVSGKLNGTYGREARSTNLEDGLHLRELGIRVLSGQHLDDETAHAPDVGLLRVRCLLHHLGCHPEHGALE